MQENSFVRCEGYLTNDFCQAKFANVTTLLRSRQKTLTFLSCFFFPIPVLSVRECSSVALMETVK